MLINPDGTSLWFAHNDSGGYTTPAGDFSTLTLSGGVNTRTMTDGTQVNFNSSGLQTSVVDTDGNTTTFNYTGGVLTSITDCNATLGHLPAVRRRVAWLAFSRRESAWRLLSEKACVAFKRDGSMHGGIF